MLHGINSCPNTVAESEQLDYKRLKVWENSSLMMERERASSESDEEDEPPSGKVDDPHLLLQ